MVFTARHYKLFREYYEISEMSVSDLAGFLNINRKTVTKWLSGNCKTVRKPVWEKFMVNSGLKEKEVEHSDVDIVIEQSMGIRLSEKGTPFCRSSHYLNSIAKNEYYDFGCSAEVSSRLALIEQIDDSLEKFIPRGDYLLVKPLDAINACAKGVRKLFSSVRTLVVGLIKGRLITRLISFASGKVTLEDSLGFTKELNEKDEFILLGEITESVKVDKAISPEEEYNVSIKEKIQSTLIKINNSPGDIVLAIGLSVSIISGIFCASLIRPSLGALFNF